MDFADAPEDEAFRNELRSGSTPNLADFEAEEIFDAEGIEKMYERRKAWQLRMAKAGWAAINWPTELGGRDATLMQNVIYSQEMAKSKAPGIYNANGVWQIGPMIIKWGTQEQKDLLAQQHPLRRGPLVPGLHRARSGLRPRQPAATRDP